MEVSTLEWIGQTLFYIFQFFVLLIISRQIFRIRFKTVDVNNELTTKDNVAFSALTVGYLIGILIIYIGVVQGESHGYLVDSILILSYGLMGNVLLILSSVWNEKVVFQKKFKLYKEIIKDENKGTGFIEAANFIGSSLIIYGAVKGKTINMFPEYGDSGLYISGFVSLIGLWVLGQVVLFIGLKIYGSLIKYNLFEELEKDNNAIGIVYASVLVAIAFLYGQAIGGDMVSWIDTFMNVFYYLGLGLVLLPISRWIIDKVILPESDLVHEIVHQEIPNQGAAFIEAFAYIGSAVLISFCI